MSGAVRINEVGPRDGLQNEPRPVPAAKKIAFVDLLSATGLRAIEVTSFVSPSAVPQLADAAEVMAGIARAPGVRYGVLVPNLRGLATARAAGADEVALFAAATDGFSRANLGAPVAASLDRYGEVAAAAHAAGLRLRGYVSCVTECPYDGAVAPAAVAAVARALHAMGCEEISLGDTLGRARPAAIAVMLEAVTGSVPPDRLAGHFHDTSGAALDNVAVALEAGLRSFDGAAGGLGGCPFAPGAAGNLATERLDAWLRARGYETGIDAAALDRAATFARGLRGP